jgi:hypothetical protein
MFKKAALILAALPSARPLPQGDQQPARDGNEQRRYKEQQRKPTNDNLWNEERRRLYRRGFAILQEEATVKDAIRFTLQRTTDWNSPAIEGLVDGIFNDWSQDRPVFSK